MSLVWTAIDPGPTQSGYAVYEGGKVLEAGVMPNDELLSYMSYGALGATLEAPLAIEMIGNYGMAVGASVFETCVWIGRFTQAWGAGLTHRIFRRDVKLHLCNSARAKDTNVRQALIDRLGPVGTKRAHGPLYSVKSHAWAALAVAVTADDTLNGGAS